MRVCQFRHSPARGGGHYSPSAGAGEVAGYEDYLNIVGVAIGEVTRPLRGSLPQNGWGRGQAYVSFPQGRRLSS